LNTHKIKKGTKAAIPPSRMPNGSEQPAQPAGKTTYTPTAAFSADHLPCVMADSSNARWKFKYF